MPLSSLFNRKSSRKNIQSKDKLDVLKTSEQNSTVKVGSTTIQTGGNSSRESVIPNVGCELYGASIPEIVRSAQVDSKDLFSQEDTPSTNKDNKLSHDCLSEIKTDSTSDVVKAEKDQKQTLSSQVEVKSSENSTRDVVVVEKDQKRALNPQVEVKSSENSTSNVVEVEKDQKHTLSSQVEVKSSENSTRDVVEAEMNQKHALSSQVEVKSSESSTSDVVEAEKDHKHTLSPQVEVKSSENSTNDVVEAEKDQKHALSSQVEIKSSENSTVDVVEGEKDQKPTLSSQEEVKSSENLDLQNTSFGNRREETLQNKDETAHYEDSCLGLGDVKYPESPPTQVTGIHKSHGDKVSEECPQKAKGQFVDQSVSGVEKCESNGDAEGRKETNVIFKGNVVNENVTDLQELTFSETCSSEFVNKQKNAEVKSEEMEVAVNSTSTIDECNANCKKADQREIPDFSRCGRGSLTAAPNEECAPDEKKKTSLESAKCATDLSKTKDSTKESKSDEPELNTGRPTESVMGLETTSLDTDTAKQVDCGSCVTADSQIESEIKKEQSEKNACVSPSNEMSGENKTMHEHPKEKSLSGNEIIADSSASDKTEGVAIENESIGDQNDLHKGAEQGKTQKEIPDDTAEQEKAQEEIRNDTEKTCTEHKPENSPEKVQKLDEKSSDDLELQVETGTCSTNESSEGDGSSSRTLDDGTAEHDAGGASFEAECVEKVTTSQSSTSTSLLTSSANTAGEKSENQSGMTENGTNSTGNEQAATQRVSPEDTNTGNKIPANDSGLMDSEENDLLLDSRHEMPAVESRTSLEDSLDSFPSECDDFLGGQRTLMAFEQQTTPSWKVGYLQVKLPVKSRGRGKLKVWRKRWVVVQMDEFVKDVKDPSLMINIYSSECSNARSHSALFWCTVSASTAVIYRSQSKTHKYAFSISVDNDVIVHLAADSETASQEWMAAIRNLLWPQSPVLQLEKVLHGSEFEVSVIDNEFSFHAGLLGTYGNMKVTSNKLILTHPQTDHVIQEWYLNTLDKFQLLPHSKEEDAYKVVVMHTGQDSSTGSGQLILYCSDTVNMLQSIASTIHKLLQYRTTSSKDANQKELADLADWLSPALSQPPTGEPAEDYYKVPRRQIRSLLDIPNFSFEKPISIEGYPQGHEAASTFSEDSGISMATQSDDYLNCSVTSFTIGGRPFRDHTSSESSDSYSPPCSPEIERKTQKAEST